ncbi:MAG: tryptophan synthase subunit alpha [Calditrichia bacterium]
MNRALDLYYGNKNNLLSIYFTAGYPSMESIPEIISALQSSKVDLIEIGIPFSDPIADGGVIQHSAAHAIHNGFTLNQLFTILESMKDHITIPIYLMGYLNPIYKFGMDNYLKQCSEIGISGSIIPDMPLDLYTGTYKSLFEEHDHIPMFLFSPNTTAKRLERLVQLSPGFMYMVSSHAITGEYLKKINVSTAYNRLNQKYKIKHKSLVGFGIRDAQTFQQACRIGRGGIIGSAFIQHISEHGISEKSIQQFINSIKDLQ